MQPKSLSFNRNSHSRPMIRKSLSQMTKYHLNLRKSHPIINWPWKIWANRFVGTMSSTLSTSDPFSYFQFSICLETGNNILACNVGLWSWLYSITPSVSMRLRLYMYSADFQCHLREFSSTAFITGSFLHYSTLLNSTFSPVATLTTLG